MTWAGPLDVVVLLEEPLEELEELDEVVPLVVELPEAIARALKAARVLAEPDLL